MHIRKLYELLSIENQQELKVENVYIVQVLPINGDSSHFYLLKVVTNQTIGIIELLATIDSLPQQC